MYDQKIHYCFTLSEEQLEYLRSKKYKIDRMECFMSLVELAERETKLVQISKVQHLGISSSQKVGDNRIHTLHAFSGWYVDGRFVKNPFATRRNADGTAIVTAEVPPARVFTIEVPDDRNKGAEGSDSGFYNSQVTSVGVVPSADGHVFHPSLQSNDSDNVGKSVTDERTSDSSQNNISHQSADIPSSHVEADGSQNEGKRNDDPSARQEGLSLQSNNALSNGNDDNHQKPNGYYNPNGFHNNE